MDLPPLANDVLDFWFGPPPLARREAWFRKDAAFDATIRARFAAAIAAARAGANGDWCTTPHGALARILLLDQFTRNAYRNTAEAFSGDARALATAEDALARGFDLALQPIERHFMYMPFEHAEDPEAQKRSLALFGALSAEPGCADLIDWAQRNADLIRRFGRYPHRNALLGRASTPEETEYLKTPGAGF
ncbi:MAG: DUF924 family protein [Casimicrobiaceae bacterium]